MKSTKAIVENLVQKVKAPELHQVTQASTPPDPYEAARISEELYRELQQEKAKEQAIDREGMAAELEEARQEVGFSARLLVQATLPHSKPKPDPRTGIVPNEFERSNGYVTVHIQAPTQYGLPYGTYPRLQLAWVTTEAVRTRSRKLELGDSLNQFMSKLKLTHGGGSQGSAPRMVRHMQRLFSSTFSATYRAEGEWQRVGFCPVVRASIFWNPKRPDQISLWRSSITLTQDFYDELINHPVPVALDTLRLLAKSGVEDHWNEKQR